MNLTGTDRASDDVTTVGIAMSTITTDELDARRA